MKLRDLERLKPLQQRLSFLPAKGKIPKQGDWPNQPGSLLRSCSVTPAATRLVFALVLSTVHLTSSTSMADQRWSWAVPLAWSHGAGSHGMSTALKLQTA